MNDYRKRLHAMANGNVVFTGYAFDTDYAQLSSHAYLYVLASAVDGTRPVLLDQMGFGNCVLVRNTPANLEVVSDCGATFDHSRAQEDLQTQLQMLLDHPELVAQHRKGAVTRIRDYYNWEWITDFYEDLFRRMKQGERFNSYDEFLKGRAVRSGVPESQPPLE